MQAMSRVESYDLRTRYVEPGLREFAHTEPNALLSMDSGRHTDCDAGTPKTRHNGDVRTCMRGLDMMNSTEGLQANREVGQQRIYRRVLEFLMKINVIYEF